MTIVVTGGGSGGHITPILAVAHELKKLQPEARIVYIGQKGDPFAEVPGRDPNIDAVYTISAGKFRRYYGEGLKQILDFKTMWLNVRDVFRIIAGFFQSRRLMRRLQPSVVFTRGGYVSVPVALGATSRHIPFITHDSDSIPSLANRLIARWAAKNAVALPANIYPYDQSKTVTVGVPVMAGYQPVTSALQAQYRQEIGLSADNKVVFIIGGGLGAQILNAAVLASMPALFEQFGEQLRVLHVAGQANEDAIRTQYEQLSADWAKQVTVFGYLDGVYRYSGAADVIITRAGASSLADFAVQGKACIVVPSPFLVGGHQLKNAAYLAEQQAIALLDERAITADATLLTNEVADLLQNADRRTALGNTFTKFGHADAALVLARLVLEEAR